MARLQILELPEGAGDDRPPFVLVIDQARIEDFHPSAEGKSSWQIFQDRVAAEDPTQRIAEQIGARAVLVFEETIEIPANEVPVDPDSYPVRVHVEGDFEKFREQVEEEIRYAQGKVTRGLKTRDKDQELRAANEWIERLTAERDEARTWARHGYEIGQRHWGWTDHGVAPAWLTDGWQPSIGTCEHLKKAAEYDEALTRVRNLPEQPEAMDAQHPDPSGYLHGYKVAIRDAKRAARSFQATGPTDG